MKSRISFALTVLLPLFFCFSSAGAETKLSKNTIIENSLSFVVTIKTGKNVGSGFVINPNGIILTSNHVLSTNSIPEVIFANGRKFAGEIFSRNRLLDIALIKIPVRNLSVAKLADSKLIKQGDKVMAIGAPYGLDKTITEGIVSFSRRELDGKIYIQTDASINPGNSGGPLLNEKGEVIGVNIQTMKESQGINFALPIDRVYEYLKKSQIPIIVDIDNEIAFTPKDNIVSDKKFPEIPCTTGILAGILVLLILSLAFLYLFFKVRKSSTKPSKKVKPNDSYSDIKIDLKPPNQK